MSKGRFIIRWGLVLFLLFLVIHLLGKSDIRIDVNYGDPHDHHHGKKRLSAQEADMTDGWEKIVFNPRERGIPPNKNVVPGNQGVAKKQDGSGESFVLAYTGKKNLPPIYLDFIDRNQPWDKTLENSMKNEWKMNKYLSDRTPLNRDTADERHATCRVRHYQRQLPAASVVLVFYNEALSVVLRTAFTVLKESDPRLIHEILLYDDCSTIDELKAPLERHIADYPKIRLVRSKERGGLVKARLYSSREARGEVLLFLDAHCEPTPGWLEPLLEPIAKDRTAVTVPSLDDINWETLVYSGAETIQVIGGVNWLMNMLWAAIPPREEMRRKQEDPYPITANLRTASMAGGLFAMNREYFKELGEYDEGLGVWGGENMELSFKIWMCGGSMVMVPCSKVGHIFRPSHPYDFMGNTGEVVSRNYIRVARVWFDEELDFFFKIRPHFEHVDVGDISERLAIREKLKCKSYAWFIKNIYPELPLQSDLIGAGEFKTEDGRCMDTRGGDLRQSGRLYLGLCNTSPGKNSNSNRFMMLTKDNKLMGLNFCCDSGYEEGLQFHTCHNQGGAQGFQYDPNTKQIKQNSGRCVTGDAARQLVVMADCREGDRTQRWDFEYRYI